MFRSWKQEIHDANEVAVNLTNMVQDLYEKAILTDENGEGHTIDVELALKSTEYKAYLNAASEL